MGRCRQSTRFSSSRSVSSIKPHYAQDVTTAVQQLKFRYFGHDAVVLHEREIRKAKGPFGFLLQADVRARFMNDLSTLIEQAEFTLIAAVVRKTEVAKWRTSPNVYHMAMEFGLERIARHYGLNSSSPRLHLICESRGKREDDDLELAFRRIREANKGGSDLPCDLVFAPKTRAHAGMELADLVARPIGRHILNPKQPNRAWDVLVKKFRRSPEGAIANWGLKVFPDK